MASWPISLHDCGSIVYKVLQPHVDVKSRKDVVAVTVCVALSNILLEIGIWFEDCTSAIYIQPHYYLY